MAVPPNFDPSDWDITARDRNSLAIHDVLLNGQSIMNVCSAVSISRGEALCYETESINPIVLKVGSDQQPLQYVASGNVAVIFDGFAIANYGPVDLRRGD